jgi:hypothetical protein
MFKADHLREFMKFLIAFTLFCLAACSNVTVKYPDFVNLKPDFIVAYGYIISGEYLPEKESQCPDGAVCISLDPPPLKLTLELKEVIHGQVDSKIIEAYTTSHYGLSTYEFDIPYLFLIRNNGEEFILPRYSPQQIAFDIKGEPTLPMLSNYDTPFWLPCDVANLNTSIEYDGSSENVLHPIESFTPEQLEEIKGFSAVSEYAVRIVRGIYLSDLRRYLSHKKVISDCE